MTLWLDFSPTLLLRIKGVKIMEKDKDFLGTEPIGKLLLRLAIPTLAAQLINMLYNVVDRIYIGHIPKVGALALTGVGVCMPLIMIVSAFAVLVGNGGAPRASIYMGQNNKEDAEKTLGNCFAAQILVAIVLTIVLLFGNRTFLLAFGASENTISYAAAYMNIYAVGTIFVQLTLGLNAFITAQGFAKTGMLSVLIGAVINIVLDPIFIYVFGMGVKGAALATIISQGVSCLWVLKFLTGKKTILKIRLKNLVLDGKIVTSVLSLGVSPFIMQATECLIQLTFNNGMLKYGNDLYVALMSILFSLTQLIWMPLNGFSQGAQPVIGYNYGAKRFDRVKKAFKLQFTVSICFSLFAVALVEVFPTAFLKMFTNDQELIDIGINSTRLFLAGMSVMGAQCACQQTFLALGEAKISMFLACLRKIILLFPLALILPNIANMGVWGLLLAEPVSDVVAASCTTIMFTIRSRKILKQ